MKKIIFIIIFVLLSTPVYAEWSEEKTAREIAFLYGLSIDWKQTIEISRNPLYFERNKILGKNPSEKSIHFYMAGFAACHALIAYLIPDENIARIWQQAFIIGQSNQATRNNDIGLDMKMDMYYKILYTVRF